MEIHKTIKIWKIKTSKRELIDIVKAWVVLSLAFGLVLSGLNLFNLGSLEGSIIIFMIMFPISLFTAGIGFLFHELGHKLMAQKYGCMAEFRAFNQMLYIALGLAATVGFIFAAPGAVMISGNITYKEYGKISLAGPLVNFVLAGLFFGSGFLIPNQAGFSGMILGYMSQIGFYINSWLGLFNLIPFGNFDGIKILHWNRYIWLGMVLVGLFLVFGMNKLF